MMFSLLGAYSAAAAALVVAIAAMSDYYWSTKQELWFYSLYAFGIGASGGRRSDAASWGQIARTGSLYSLIKAWPDSKFERFFKVSRSTFKRIVREVKKDPSVKHHYGITGTGKKRRGCPPKFKLRRIVMATLFRLTTSLRVEHVGDFFGMSGTQTHHNTWLIINALNKVKRQWIVWPDPARRAEVKSGFKGIYGLQGCIGAVDGVHMPVTTNFWTGETENLEAEHVNRHGTHSIMMQGIVDHQRRFTNISVGWPGSVNDARVWKCCSVSKHAKNAFAANEYVIGDSAYPCCSYCIPPYSRKGNLAAEKKEFNHKHSSTRVVVEHSFGMLKGRFKVLKHLQCSLDNAPKIITACVVLHNIAREEADEYLLGQNLPHPKNPHHPLPEDHKQAGRAHRDRLMRLITKK
jgi:hypothetical protein